MKRRKCLTLFPSSTCIDDLSWHVLTIMSSESSWQLNLPSKPRVHIHQLQLLIIRSLLSKSTLKLFYVVFCCMYSSCVRIVSSDRSGMGKSLYIKRLAQNLAMNLSRTEEAVHVTIPLHGPLVTPDTVLHLFKDHFKNQTCCIYHIDISPSVRICIFW